MTVVLVAGGDSISFAAVSYFYQYLGVSAADVPALGKSYTTAAQLSTQSFKNADGSIVARNMAVPGTRLNTNGFPDLVPLAPLLIDTVVSPIASQRAANNFRKHIFSNYIGSNDGAGGLGQSAADYAALVVACCAARKAAGFDRVILGTLLPRADTTTMPEASRLAYNTILRTPGWAAANGIDGIFDFAIHPIMGDPANLSNTDYFLVDKIHPAQGGYALLVPTYAATMTAVLATLGIVG